jgi:ankyrin repeat protein
MFNEYLLPEDIPKEIFDIKKGLISILKTFDSLDNFYQHYIQENNCNDITLVGDAIIESSHNIRHCLYILDLLIKMGVHINYRNPDGITALFIDVLHSNTVSTMFLLQNHIDDTIQDNNGNTALIYACSLYDDYEIIDLLSNNPLTINMANKLGKTPFLSIPFITEKVIDLLCSKNANVQATDNNGNNALHLAIISKKSTEKILLKLLSLGLDINAKNNDGETAIFLAFKHYEYDKAKILVQNGADFSIENNKGQTIMSISKGSMFAHGILNIK